MAYNYDDDAPVNQFPQDQIPDPWSSTLIVVMDDGDTLCETCMRDPRNPVHDSRSPDESPYGADGWGVVGFDYGGNTDEDTRCAHCNRQLSDYYEE